MPGQGWSHYLFLFFRGVLMGAADVVPGVSGGTIAFITGIYEELINSLRRIDHRALRCLVREGPFAAWQYINAGFLVAVFAGVLFSLFSLAKVIQFCLDHYPVLVWSFFFGLILASIIHLGRNLSLSKPSILFLFAAGAGLALAISMARPASMPAEWWMVMLAGAIAICAMILPGISGSFILLLMGMYGVFLRAIAEVDLILLGSFGAGCIMGLLAFSHFLGWLLQRWHAQTLAVLTGFLLGSLNIIWPWKHTLETRVNRHGETVPFIQENVLPTHYETLTGLESFWWQALLLAVVGLILVLLIEWFFERNHDGQSIDAE